MMICSFDLCPDNPARAIKLGRQHDVKVDL